MPLRPTLNVLLAGLIALPLAGCYGIHTRAVNRTVIAPNVQQATLDQLRQNMNTQYGLVQSLNATVDITAKTGGEHKGEVKEIPTFAGYMLLRKPTDLRFLLLVPVLRSTALDMVSDGHQFKLWIPSKSRAIEGADEVTTPSKNGLENLRPSIIRDALLIPAIAAEEYITLTENSRILPSVTAKKEAIEEPDYDITVLRPKSGHVLERVRVIHISRVTLKPYEQDLYDPAGRIVTIVRYDKYQRFNDVDFPMSIVISRPIDEYELRIDVSKLQVNTKLDDEQFLLKIPDNIKIQKM